MNYNKMRRILIFMLICTNLIMFYSLSKTYKDEQQVHKNMIENNIQFLETQNIYVSKEILQKQVENNSILSYLPITQQNIQKIIQQISSNENNLFIGENGTAKINDDGSFAINLNGSHTKESIEKILKDAGFDLQKADIKQQDDLIRYTLKFGDYLVSNCFFEVILSSNTTTIAGKYVFSEPQITQNENDFSAFLAIIDICDKNKISGEILSAEFQYRLDEGSNFKVFPVFKILINGKEYYYNISENIVAYF